jgi:NAD(P)-dependent dehydrogenase (short-subunit alcohol dehydrogenase family)
MKFSQTKALITGASRGLGRSLASELGRAGAEVVLVARELAPLEQLVEDIRTEGGTAFALAADIADKQASYPLAAAAAELVGPIDLLIHNASTLGPTPLRLLLDTECEDLERVLAVNLVGPFRLSRIIAGSMALRKSGTIVHVSSDAAVNAYERWGCYSASKAAQDHLSRVWAQELLPFGVRVLSFDPGEMDTAMHRAAMPEADPSTLASPDEVAKRLLDALANVSLASGSRSSIDSLGTAS